MDQSAPTQFRAALTYLLEQEGRGAQTRLADELKIDRGYLNAIVRGRKSGSEKKRGQIAAHFDLLYEDMLSLGRRILNGEEISTKSDDDNTANNLPGNEINGHQQETDINDDGVVGKPVQGSENVSTKIIALLQMLESGTAYADMLDRLLDSYQETVSKEQKIQQLEEKIGGLKEENLKVNNQMKELESRLDRLESRSDGEKEILRKTA